MNKSEKNAFLQSRFDCVITSLVEYISALRSAEFEDVADFVELGNAEKALYALRPEHEILKESFALERWKQCEKLVSGPETKAKDCFFDVLQGSLVEYSAPNKPQTFFEFPKPENLNLSCRFAGRLLLFTGFWPEEKAQLYPLVELLNIRQGASVSRKLDFLVCRSNAGPAKVRKAQELNIPMIPAAEFIAEITKREIEP